MDVYYPVLAIAALVGLVWFTVIVAPGRTRYPRWVALLNPLLLIIAGSLVNDLLPGRMARAGAGFNLGLMLFFILSSAHREPRLIRPCAPFLD